MLKNDYAAMGCINMTQIRKMIVALCVVAFVFLVSPTANAAVTLGFSTKSLPEEEKVDFIDGIGLKLIHNDGKKNGIECFDVNKNGMVALAFQSAPNGWIYVYDANGEFQYGYSFQVNGEYGIEFYKEYLAIYFSRGDYIVLCDSSGSCIDVQVKLYPNQNHERAKEILKRSTKELDNKQYVLERDIPYGDAYSRCVVIDEQGTRTVLLDNTIEHMPRQIFEIATLAVLLGFWTWGMRKKLKQAEEE